MFSLSLCVLDRHCSASAKMILPLPTCSAPPLIHTLPQSSSLLFLTNSYSSSSSSLVSCLSSKLKFTAQASFSSLAKSNESHRSRYSTHDYDFISVMKRKSESGAFPKSVALTMEELYLNYRNAVHSSGIPDPDDVVLSNMGAMLDLVLMDMEDPFIFQPYHKAVREPFDYYVFGQNYIRPLIDFGNSYVGNISIFHKMEEKLQQGHNIVLMSNHQTEADPAVISLLLEKTNPYIGENLIYVAGDRVITDPLCKPFSMGRNLLCVYSKKHMHDNPELIDVKKRANTRSLKELALLLRDGSKIIWIAPSGGRDRPDAVTGEWNPATFDFHSVDNMRRLVEHAGIPGHIYPLALLCYDIMPPPAQVEKAIGEKRMISYHGVGLSVGPTINYRDLSRGYEDEEEAKSAYAQDLYTSVSQQYNVLKAAVHGKKGLGASTAAISLSQPWTC